MRVSFLLLIVFIYIEVVLFGHLADALSGLAVLLQIILTAVLGMKFVRWQGLQTLYRAREKASFGQSPASEIIDGTLLAAAGAALVVPGMLSDTLGLVLLFPFMRKAVSRLRSRQQSPSQPHSHVKPDVEPDSSAHSSNGQVIDGEYKREDS